MVERLQAIMEEAHAAMDEAKYRQKHYADERRREDEFDEGERVWLSTENISTDLSRAAPSRKFIPRYIGPYLIEKKLSGLVYRLKLPRTMKIHPVFHISRLRRYHDRPEELGDRPTSRRPDPIIRGANEEYEVEEVIDTRKVRRGRQWHRQYLVKWLGYPPEEAQWEPAVYLKNARQKIAQFKARQRHAEMMDSDDDEVIVEE